MLTRNKHAKNCQIRMLWVRSVKTRQPGPGNMTPSSVLIETQGFLMATIPRIGPVLLQKKQVDQASANQRQVVGDLAVEFEGPI